MVPATNSRHSTGRSKREMRARSMKTCARQAAAVSTVGAWRPEAHRIAQPSRYAFKYTSAFVVNRENFSLFLGPFGRKNISGVIDKVGDACVTEFFVLAESRGFAGIVVTRQREKTRYRFGKYSHISNRVFNHPSKLHIILRIFIYWINWRDAKNSGFKK